MKFAIFLILLTRFSTSHLSEEEMNKAVNEKIITCGSILRIQNVLSKFHLHSHRLTWGSGSHQQSVTGMLAHDDPNSLWVIKEAYRETPCETGSPIQCGQIIRLEHVNTGKNLHSHDYPSFITSSQEASCLGEDGEGDVNDNFQLICKDPDDKILKGSSKFQLYHKPTNAFVYINLNSSLFNEYNCRGCPIMGQREVSLTKSLDLQTVWKVVGGIIFGGESQ